MTTLVHGPSRSRAIVEAEAKDHFSGLVDRALTGDRTALDAVVGALPPYLATELVAFWHYARAGAADRRG